MQPHRPAQSQKATLWPDGRKNLTRHSRKKRCSPRFRNACAIQPVEIAASYQSKADVMRLSFLLAYIVLTGGHDPSRAHPSPLRQEPSVLSIQCRYDPCRDDRASDGCPQSRAEAEMARAFRHDRWRSQSDDEFGRREESRVNPCTDGRFGDG